MELIRLTRDNVTKYIGYEILFKTRGIYLVKKILGINDNSIRVEHKDLNNQLEFLSRKIFVIID